MPDNLKGDVASSSATITPTARIHKLINIHTDYTYTATATQEKADFVSVLIGDFPPDCLKLQIVKIVKCEFHYSTKP